MPGHRSAALLTGRASVLALLILECLTPWARAAVPQDRAATKQSLQQSSGPSAKPAAKPSTDKAAQTSDVLTSKRESAAASAPIPATPSATSAATSEQGSGSPSARDPDARVRLNNWRAIAVILALTSLVIAAIPFLRSRRRRPKHGASSKPLSAPPATAGITGPIIQTLSEPEIRALVAATTKQLVDREFETFEAAIRKLLGEHAVQLTRLEQKNLTGYFDDWKEQHLYPGFRDQMRQFQHEVAANADVSRARAAGRDAHAELYEPGCVWFAAMGKWLSLMDGISGDQRIDGFQLRLRNYVDRGNTFLRQLDALKQTDLTPLSEVAPPALTFADVVWGRSAALLGGNFQQRLMERCEEVQRQAANAPAQWTELRDEVLPLLDEYSGVIKNYERSDPSDFCDRSERIRNAWRSARLEEMRIDDGSSAYNPGVHEVLTTQACADVPDRTVLSVERAGFYCDSKVLRRALVVVSAADSAART